MLHLMGEYGVWSIVAPVCLSYEGLDAGGTECDLGCLEGSTLSLQLLKTIFQSANTKA